VKAIVISRVGCQQRLCLFTHFKLLNVAAYLIDVPAEKFADPIRISRGVATQQATGDAHFDGAPRPIASARLLLT
jgi:hypothetical protein